MSGLTLVHPVTGHEVKTDKDSSEFWQAAGYAPVKPARRSSKKDDGK